MKCIYRKIISYEKFVPRFNGINERYATTRNKATDVKVEFADCYGYECPMYSEGKCVKALREIEK